VNGRFDPNSGNFDATTFAVALLNKEGPTGMSGEAIFYACWFAGSVLLAAILVKGMFP